MHRTINWFYQLVFSFVVLGLSCEVATATPNTILTTLPQKQNITQYIHSGWQKLSRSVTDCAAYDDTKIGAQSYLYLPYKYPIPQDVIQLQKDCLVKVAFLPRKINNIGDVKTGEVSPPGLLYLPHRYVVPGGFFNEMYGWDSYFIILGLLNDGELDLAKGMLDNYFFEIKNYGTILNANRSYYLSRSQPPFLTSTILAVYFVLKPLHKVDKDWLAQAYKHAVHDYKLWIKPPYLAGNTALSRYYDVEDGRLVETKTYPHFYEKVVNFVKTNPDLTIGYIKIGNPKSLPVIFSNDFYQGERSLRASGFDITFRFGPYGGKTHHYAAVCLNSLLYKTESDLAVMAGMLGNKHEKKYWTQKAAMRRAAIFKYMWDAKTGLFYDYDFMLKKRSSYKYATTFYPLWVGLATKNQAAAIVKNLNIFEQAGGLAMSDKEAGVQWDKPFGWAPVHLLAVEGLMKYGYSSQALRLAKKFNNTVYNNYIRTGNIYEKYNVVNSSSTLTIQAGYAENVVGFGWTNAVYLVLSNFIKDSYNHLYATESKFSPKNININSKVKNNTVAPLTDV